MRTTVRLSVFATLLVGIYERRFGKITDEGTTARSKPVDERHDRKFSRVNREHSVVAWRSGTPLSGSGYLGNTTISSTPTVYRRIPYILRHGYSPLAHDPPSYLSQQAVLGYQQLRGDRTVVYARDLPPQYKHCQGYLLPGGACCLVDQSSSFAAAWHLEPPM